MCYSTKQGLTACILLPLTFQQPPLYNSAAIVLQHGGQASPQLWQYVLIKKKQEHKGFEKPSSLTSGQ